MLALGAYTEISNHIYQGWSALLRGTPSMRYVEDHALAGSILARYLMEDVSALAPEICGSKAPVEFISPEFGVLEDDILHHSACWRRYGAPTFRLTHGLAAGLLLTDPARLPWAEVRLPFPSFVV